MLSHVCAHMFPSRCAGIGPFAGTTSPYLSRSFDRTYAWSDTYSGRTCSQSRSTSAAKSPGGMSYLERQRAPASL